MKTKLLLFISLLTIVYGCNEKVSIIPMPVEVVQSRNGNFKLNNNMHCSYSEEVINSANYLQDYFRKYYDITLKINNDNKSENVDVRLIFDESFNNGQYELSIDKEGINIKGSEDGVFYGVQSLIQLLPVSQNQSSESINVPYIVIKDEPRFSYRGLLMDVGRYFFPVEFLKRCVDFAAIHKMNKLHIHLTDDQGWRIEIDKYPKLTEVGAWRESTMIGLYPGTGYDGKRHGGIYTREELQELVEYAKKRYVTIIPEIEMPGHALAALTSYSYLGCTGGPYKVKEEWGAGDDVFCAGNDSTFLFLENVLDEVIEIFPSEYIHIGGDECPKDRWKECPKCQKRIKNENLKNEDELQSYFITRIEKYLNEKGRSIIGWDEILEGGVAPNATVMSWRGDAVSGCLKAVEAKRPVIITPSYGFYLDYPQTSKEDSLAADWGGVTPVKKTYLYEPIPAQLTADEAKFVIGGQTAIWTEYINNSKKAEYMAFPRISAVSEVLWSSKEHRNWSNFKKRMESQYARYKLWDINFNPANLDEE